MTATLCKFLFDRFVNGGIDNDRLLGSTNHAVIKSF